jgi:hypothetical protein
VVCEHPFVRSAFDEAKPREITGLGVDVPTILRAKDGTSGCPEGVNPRMKRCLWCVLGKSQWRKNQNRDNPDDVIHLFSPQRTGYLLRYNYTFFEMFCQLYDYLQCKV